MTTGGLLKYFGIMILATRYEFGSRADLWSTTNTSKYVEAPCLGKKTGMSRNRFDKKTGLAAILTSKRSRKEMQEQNTLTLWVVVLYCDDYSKTLKPQCVKQKCACPCHISYVVS